MAVSVVTLAGSAPASVWRRCGSGDLAGSDGRGDFVGHFVGELDDAVERGGEGL